MNTRRLARIIVAFGLLTGLGACSGARSADQFFGRDNFEEFPKDRYLSAVGVGDDCSRAEDAARGRIASYFSSSVVMVEREEERYSSSSGKGKVREERALNRDSFTRSRSEAVLENVQIARTGRLSDGTCAALAVLDRRAELAGVRARLAVLDEECARLELDARSADPRVQAGGLAGVLERAEEQKLLEQRQRLLGGPSGEPRNLEPLRVRWAELFAGPLALRVDTGEETLDALFLETMGAMGLGAGGQDAPFVLRSSSLRMLEEAGADSRGNPCVLSAVTVTVAPAAGGEPVFTRAASDRVCHPDAQGRRTLALREARKKIVEPVLRSWFDYATMRNTPAAEAAREESK
jgi:hypothetical protein